MTIKRIVKTHFVCNGTKMSILSLWPFRILCLYPHCIQTQLCALSLILIDNRINMYIKQNYWTKPNWKISHSQWNAFLTHFNHVDDNLIKSLLKLVYKSIHTHQVWMDIVVLPVDVRQIHLNSYASMHIHNAIETFSWSFNWILSSIQN